MISFLVGSVPLLGAETDNIGERRIDRHELPDKCRVIATDRDSDGDITDAGRLSQRQSKRSNSTDRQSVYDSQRQRSRYSIMEPLSDIRSHRKCSTSEEPSSVHRANASQRSGHIWRRLQWAELDHSPSQSRSQSSSKESDSSEMESTRRKKLVNVFPIQKFPR